MHPISQTQEPVPEIVQRPIREHRMPTRFADYYMYSIRTQQMGEMLPGLEQRHMRQKKKNTTS